MKKTNKGASVVGGVAWKFAERLLAQGVAFLVSLILARLLAPEDYGVIALVLVFINLADVFVTSGMSTALIQKKDADELDFSTMFYCSLGLAVGVYALLYVCAPGIAAFYDNPILIPVLRVFALRIPLSAYLSIQTAYVARHMLFRSSFFSSLAAQILAGGCGIAMALTGFGVWALIAQYFATTIVSSLMLMVIVPWRPRLLFSWNRAKELMRFGSRVLLADLSGSFFSELRSLLIGRAYTEADLAYYNKGQQLPQLIANNLNVTIMSVLFPALANEIDSMDRVKEMTRRGISCLCYILMPVMLGMAAVMGPLIRVLYTAKWDFSVFFGQIYCISSAIGFVGVVSLQVLKAIGRGDEVLKLEFFKKPVYVLLLVVGMKINVTAIAVTMLLYDFYSTYMNLHRMCKHIHYTAKEVAQDILPNMALAGLMAAVVSCIRLPGDFVTLVVAVCAGVAIYVAGSWLLKLPGFTFALDLLKGLLKKVTRR